MMDRENDFDGIIRSIIYEELRYLRHYIAKVEDNQDPDGKGKILVTIPMLGWDTQRKGHWAIPRQMRGLSIPAKGEYVEVYFINGSVHTPAYMGLPMEVQNMIPKNWTDPKTHVIWEAPGDENQVIMFDENQKRLDIKADKIRMNEGTEKYVLGDALDTWINNTLKAAWADVHVHTSAAPGAPTSAPTVLLTAPTNYLSTTITGK